jgi:hypothetical protein
MAKSNIAENLQNKIFRKMSADKKIKIVSQFFEFGKKLSQLRKQKFNGNTKTSLRNRKNFGKT